MLIKIRPHMGQHACIVLLLYVMIDQFGERATPVSVRHAREFDAKQGDHRLTLPADPAARSGCRGRRLIVQREKEIPVVVSVAVTEVEIVFAIRPE